MTEKVITSVIGQRTSLETADDGLDDSDDDTPTSSCGRKHSFHRKRGAHSLPRALHKHDRDVNPTATGATFRKVDSLPVNLMNQSYAFDRKKRSRRLIFQSLGHFVQNVVRQIASVTRHSAAANAKSNSKPSTKPNERSAFGKIAGRSAKSSECLNNNQTPKTSSSASPTNNASFTNPGAESNSPIPGVVGLYNHGNTCFMNAVLQCLSNTEYLVGYFITDRYKEDIRRSNKLTAKRYGTRGELTEHLATLLKSLWTCRYAAEISGNFKAIVGKYSSQYRGYAQQDAQEFLMWLLDKVHEDLNVATKKKYRPNKSSHGRPDDIVASEALANHARCNSSFVYDLFQALYRSSLTCVNCRYHSNTFDPYLSVSLPIPYKTQHPVYVTVVYLSATPKQVRIGLLMELSDTVLELRRTLASDTKIPEDQLVLTEIYFDGFRRTFSDRQPITDLQETNNVYAIETPPLPVATPDNKLPSTDILILALNKLVDPNQGLRFGEPLVLQVALSSSLADLQVALLQSMYSRLCEGFMFVPMKTNDLFRLRVVESFPEKGYLLTNDIGPLLTERVQQAVSRCVPGSGPRHIKLIAEWDRHTRQRVIANCVDSIEEHESVRQVRLAYQQPVLGTLDECFHVYTQEERLSTDDLWLCPSCRRRQQGTIKSLSLWSLPEVLVVHLKRFKQEGYDRIKLNTLVMFPITGLDMRQHVQKCGLVSIRSKPLSWKLKPPSHSLEGAADEFTYDLYAVCNHYGNMQGGHYTAFCRNPVTGLWYTFNDSKTSEMREQEVVTRAAYLLFYQKRSAARGPVSEADPLDWRLRLRQLDFSSIPRTVTSHSLDDCLDTETDAGKRTDFTDDSLLRSDSRANGTPSSRNSDNSQQTGSSDATTFDHDAHIFVTDDELDVLISTASSIAEHPSEKFGTPLAKNFRRSDGCKSSAVDRNWTRSRSCGQISSLSAAATDSAHMEAGPAGNLNKTKSRIISNLVPVSVNGEVTEAVLSNMQESFV